MGVIRRHHHHHHHHRSVAGTVLGAVLYGFGWYIGQVLRLAAYISLAALVLELVLIVALLGFVVWAAAVAWRWVVGVLGYGDATPRSGVGV